MFNISLTPDDFNTLIFERLDLTNPNITKTADITGGFCDRSMIWNFICVCYLFLLGQLLTYERNPDK